MSFVDVIYSLIIEPLRLLFEFVFFFAFKSTDNVWLSILMMSLVINILLLPLYFRADMLEKEQNAKKKLMKPWVDKIKTTFKGDEKIMMLQAYYRENNYKSTDVLKESVSLFLQIPFFIAAYSFLSGLSLLHGTSLGPIKDLGVPDALISIGGFTVNLLPILMTVINIVSGFIYSEKGAFKDKIKLILIALVFLVLLYNSPAGLVFYWTLNNIFSLLKNIVTHFIKPAPKKAKPDISGSHSKDMALIYLCCTVLAIMTGLMIPSDIIDKSPLEFINTYIDTPHSPMTYIINSTLIAAGTFMIWIPVFAYLVKGRHGKTLSYIFAAFTACGMVNYLAFNKAFGMMTYKLTYEKPMVFEAKDIILNILADIAVIAVVMVIGYKLKNYITKIVAVILISSVIFSGTSIGFFIYAYHGTNYSVNSADEISFRMTSTGKNVVVLMMDMMIGSYIPYVFTEHPELVNQFDGFTYYPNTISFGPRTNMGSPALFGGYEYTPARLNERSDELLKDKHNEALRVLPTMFSNEGWDVTVSDVPYTNYSWLFDASIYDYDDNINAFSMSMAMKNDELTAVGADMEERLNRDLFCYGLMKILPCFIQPLIYSDGSYNYLNNSTIPDNLLGTYVREHTALASLGGFTDISDSPTDCFIMYNNGTAHDFCLLSEDKYDTPPTVNGVPMYLDDEEDYKHYQCVTEACILIGRWLDFLRENNIYDNTRIIIVADHGSGLNSFDDLISMDLGFDAEWVNPVLMVKDFDQEGFTVSDKFMTNADTPFMAVNGVIEDPVNPYTDNPILENDKSDEQLVYVSHEHNTITNNGTRFKDPNGYWLTVKDNIYDSSNWKAYDGEPGT